MRTVLFLFALILVLVLPCHAQDQEAPPVIPDPEGEAFVDFGRITDPMKIADTYLGMPYRVLGAVDDQGRFVNFEHQEIVYDSPGVNCSGLVLSACRFLLRKNFTIDWAIRDRQGNSAPDSPLGKEWDYGWDLIFNLAEAYSPRLVLPEPVPGAGNSTAVPPANATAMDLRGFDLLDLDAWAKVLPQMSQGHVYLLSWSKATTKPGFKLLHYHVGFILVDKAGGAWLYHATRKTGVHRMNLRSEKGMALFRREFTSKSEKKLLIVEAALPEILPLGPSDPMNRAD